MAKCECKYPDWQYYGRGTRMCHRCGATQYATWVEGRGTVFLDQDAPQNTAEAAVTSPNIQKVPRPRQNGKA